MKSIVTLKQLVTLVARAAGVDTQMSTRFIDEFTRAVASGLERDGRVDISGFGTFSRDGLSGDEITFVPSDDIAAAINAPFDMFEAEELADEFIEEERATESVPSVPAADIAIEEMVSTATILVREEQPMPAIPDATHMVSEPEPAAPKPDSVRPPYPAYSEPEQQPIPEPEQQPVQSSEPPSVPAQGTARPPYPAYSEPAPEPVQQPEPTPQFSSERYADDDYSHDYDGRQPCDMHRKRVGFGSYVLMMIGFVMLSFFIGAVAGYFTHPMLNKALSPDDADVPTVEQISTEAPDVTSTTAEQPTDTLTASEEPDVQASEPTQSQPAIVTDTVKAGNSLARIARTHYGKSDFWVYIYIENESKLGNPDLIASGTILVIPPAEQYGIDSNDPESIRRARAKASEIYNKYH